MGKTRDARFDTLKGVLILSVVFGHFFAHDATSSASSDTLANFIYFFHMPLFVFISGYFSSSKNVIRSGIRIIETYVVFQLIKGIWLHYSFYDLLTLPGPMLWYLIALLFWRLIYAGMCRLGIRVSWHMILFLIILSVLAGFVPWIGRRFALSRFLYFAPYFFLGTMVKEVAIIDVIKERVSLKMAWGGVILAAIIGAIFVVRPILSIRGVFAGADPYPTDSEFMYMMARLFSFPVAIIVSICIIRIFSIENIFFCIIGRDSLKYYMFHGVILMGIEALRLPWATCVDVTCHLTTGQVPGPRTVTLVSFLAPIYALCVSTLIYFINKTKMSDILLSPISFFIKQRDIR